MVFLLTFADALTLSQKTFPCQIKISCDNVHGRVKKITARSGRLSSWLGVVWFEVVVLGYLIPESTILGFLEFPHVGYPTRWGQG